MSLKINQVTFDSHDPAHIAGFWAEAMGWSADAEDPIVPGAEMAAIVSQDTEQVMLFIRVPEGKVVKNRLHLDVAPTDSTRDAEVERLVGLGASVYDDQRRTDGTGWVVMRDPEGNEFCVERADSERVS